MEDQREIHFAIMYNYISRHAVIAQWRTTDANRKMLVTVRQTRSVLHKDACIPCPAIEILALQSKSYRSSRRSTQIQTNHEHVIPEDILIPLLI